VTQVFSQIVIADTEYEITAGELPNPLCLVAYVLDENLRHVRTIRLWRGEFGSAPPFDIGPDTLFVAYSAWAELTCFKVLGWSFPVHVFDLHTAYLAASNVLLPYDPNDRKKKPSRKLPDACRAYGIEGWEHIDKVAMAKDIGAGQWRKYGRDAVLDYCEEDVRKSTQLLRRQLRGNALLPVADVPRTLHWSNYSARAIALVQARGIPIDLTLWNLVQENKDGVIGHLLEQFDPSHSDDDPIYTPEGEWSYARFERWLLRTGITAWPRLESGALDTSGDAFRMMSNLPGIEGLHALRDSIGFIAKARLPIGRDGRNRPSLFPFGTLTGRNAHTRSPFNAHAGVRSFIVFPPDTIGVYLDWRSQEVAVAAAHSGDQALIAAYRSGDVYHALAQICGFTDDPDPEHWKANNQDTRQRMKTLQLAISYGMGVPSLAKGLDRHPLIASGIIERHRRTYPRFWQWRDETILTGMLTRRLESCFGWPLRIATSPNKRTLCNFPAQSAGAEMLRLATVRLCEAGIVPVMLIHDGILLEVNEPEQIEHAKEIMRGAGRDVCDGLLEIGVDTDQLLIGGRRYRDKRLVAQRMWATIMAALEAVKAIPRRA
jgi:DNA polymerase I